MRPTSLAACEGWPHLEALEPRILLDAAAEAQALELFSVSPALFVENQGQWADPSVRYVHNGSGANVAMTDSGPVFQVFRQVPREGADGTPEDDLPPALSPDLPDPERYDTQVLQFSAMFLGANTVRPVGLGQSEAYFNYFVGDQADWRSEVPAYEQVAYQGLYDGIDLVTWGQRDSLKYEFRVAPGGDWLQVQVRYDGIAGLSLTEDGLLVVGLGEGWGSLTDDAPTIYQTIDGERQEVAGQFVLVDEWTYSFEITGAYDPSQALVIDPDLAWATYWGGDGGGYDDDRGYGIAVDSAGCAYVTGHTDSPNLTTPGSYDRTHNGQSDVFVAKLNESGGGLAYCTYLGGNGTDEAFAIAVDAAGSAYVTGSTWSDGWATAGAYDTTRNGLIDVFVAKINSTGTSLLYCTYLGGSHYDYGQGIALDAAGNAYVTGYTGSSGWATVGAYDTTHNGDYDAFVAKVNSTGTGLLYMTYLGGDGYDRGYGIALGPAGDAYVTGYTQSAGWATPDAYDSTFNGGRDVFVAKVSGDGRSLLYCTYLGGSNTDEGHAIAVDPAGNAYVTGKSGSGGWATLGAYQDQFYGFFSDTFVAKLDDTGTNLLYATYLGRRADDEGYGIAVDPAGNAYVTGWSDSGDSWATPGAYDTTPNGCSDIFVAKLNAGGSDLLYCTYLGGRSSEAGLGIALDSAGNVYVTGFTMSGGWATPGAFDTTHNGGADVFVAKVSNTGDQLLYATYFGGGGEDLGRGIAVDADGNVYATGSTSSAGWATAGTYNTVYSGGHADVFVVKMNGTGSVLYCTYLGGARDDYGDSIAVDSAGNVYMTGSTDSPAWATSGAYDRSLSGYEDVFVARLDSTGTTLLYCTYLGGSGCDMGLGIALDSAGNAYVTGYTGSPALATPGAYDTTHGGEHDAFVAKVSSDGSSLIYFTYLGGSGEDRGYGIAVDTVGSAYVTGGASSSGLATPGAYDTTFGGSSDTFVAKLSASGSALAYFTYLGGDGSDEGYSIAVDAAGTAYVTGYTYCSGLATPGAYDTTYGGSADAFVAKLSATGSALSYFTYLGGSGWDRGLGIALDSAGNAYVTGETQSPGLATSDAYDVTYNGSVDVFVAKFDPGSGLLYCTYLGGSSIDVGASIALDRAGNVYVTGYTDSPGWATPGAYDTVLNRTRDAFLAKIDAGPSYVMSINVNGKAGRSVSSIEPSGIGVRTIEVTFSEPVTFAPGAVVLKAVEFSGGSEVEVPGALPAVSVTGSGTNVMTITLGDPAGTVGAVDTWVKVALAAAGITDAAGNALDGEPENDSSGLGYIYEAVEDLPSGDGTPGGDAVFYVGSLRGDMRGAGFFQPNSDGVVNVWDINGFVSKYTKGDLDADMRGAGFFQPNPDGVVNVWDINGFVSFYQAAIRNGTHLDPLPTAGPLAPAAAAPLAAGNPATEPSDEADFLALAVASGTVVRPAPGLLPGGGPLVDFALVAPTGLPAAAASAAALAGDVGLGLTLQVEGPAAATSPWYPPAETGGEDPGSVSDGDLTDLLALPALEVL